MERFAGRTVFITGGGHGIGRATALRLAREGATVTVSDRDADAAAAVANEITAAGGRAGAAPADVTDRGQVDAVVTEAVARMGRLDVLVNTAGGDTPEPPFAETPDDLWQRMLDLNLLGVMRPIRAALPYLRASGHGSIVTVGSINGELALGSFPYSAAKAALENMTKNLAASEAPAVRVNLVAPGTVRTRV